MRNELDRILLQKLLGGFSEVCSFYLFDILLPLFVERERRKSVLSNPKAKTQSNQRGDGEARNKEIERKTLLSTFLFLFFSFFLFFFFGIHVVFLFGIGLD